MVRIGSLFSGYGGLDMAAESLTSGRTVWMCDIEKTPSKIIEQRWGVPNLGDITKIDWGSVEPIDVLTGGFPCQDVSSSGRRKGLRPGTRSGLWSHMAYAIDQLRPKLVMIENVRGLLNASATCEVEPCPWCVGDRSDFDVRALGVVLGDLARLGYDARWQGFRASDIGAPHERFRVFIAAYPQGDEQRESIFAGLSGQPWADDQEAVADADGSGSESAEEGQELGRDSGPDGSDHGRPAGVALFPTPGTTRHQGTSEVRRERNQQIDLVHVINDLVLLPTPLVQDAGHDRRTVEEARASDFGAYQVRNVINSLPKLPTPAASYMDASVGRRATVGTYLNIAGVVELRPDLWGSYAPAIARWEMILGRAAPDPRLDDQKLNPAFVEWMMGLPEGWVTGLGLSRSTALKALGNGVVPQQAEAAFRFMISYPNTQEIAA